MVFELGFGTGNGTVSGLRFRPTGSSHAFVSAHTRARSNVDDVLAANPEIDCMVGFYSYNPPKIYEALQASGRLGEITVVAFDEDPITLGAVREGTFAGTVVQDPYQWGYQGMLLMAAVWPTALDVTTQAQILKLISDIQRRKGMSVMFITHDFSVVAEIADSVVVMEKGRVVEQGTADQVLKAPRHDYTRRLIAAVPHLRGEDRAKTGGADETPLLEVRNLVKTYASGSALLRTRRVVPAVQDVSFRLQQGSTLGIVGESGSGKSSLGRLLVRLMAMDSGQIVFEGEDIASLSEAEFRSFRPKIQMIFQDPLASLNPRMTVGTILTVGPMAHGVKALEARTQARELLQLVGLDAGAFGRYPHEFSGGQRQRIGIARALMFRPRLLVADEAVSALDVSIQAQILELLERVERETGVSMVFITHDLRVASQICDDIAVMHKGRIVEQGPPSQIFLNPRSAYTRELVAAIPGEDLKRSA